MRIVIAGGSGFIGKPLSEFLVRRGHDVVILTRKSGTGRNREGLSFVQWLTPGAVPENDIKHANALINLAGESINHGRWSSNHQKRIYDSRIAATEELIRILAALPQKPSVLINASAIGLYPPSNEAVYTEASEKIGEDFLARTVRDWETKAKQAETFGIRTVLMRFGVVLGKEGVLPLISLPYRLFVGGTIGSGEQWVSWIHISDAVRAVAFALEKEELKGPVNVTAPSPVRMKDFGKTIGSVLHRPHWLPFPVFAMKGLLGKKSALVLEGQCVLPHALQSAGFDFQFPTLEATLKELLQ